MKKAILVLAAALVAASGVAAEGRVIAVVGGGAVPYTPDFVRLGFSAVTREPTYAEAQERNLASVEAALRAIEGFGVAKADVATLDYFLSEEFSFENGKRQREGYVATTRMSVTLRDIASYRPLITALLDAGVNAVDSVSFGANDLASLKAKALVAAYADAERKAAAVALASKSRLGPVLQFRESDGSGSGGPVAAKIALRADAAGNGQVISSGTTLVEAEAYVEFALK